MDLNYFEEKSDSLLCTELVAVLLCLCIIAEAMICSAPRQITAVQIFIIYCKNGAKNQDSKRHDRLNCTLKCKKITEANKRLHQNRGNTCCLCTEDFLKKRGAQKQMVSFFLL